MASPCRADMGNWLRGQDLNLRPSGYEPDELPDCSTPRQIDERIKRREVKLCHFRHPESTALTSGNQVADAFGNSRLQATSATSASQRRHSAPAPELCHSCGPDRAPYSKDASLHSAYRQAGRRSSTAWASVPLSTCSNSPPTGRPRAMRLTLRPLPVSNSLM